MIAERNFSAALADQVWEAGGERYSRKSGKHRDKISFSCLRHRTGSGKTSRKNSRREGLAQKLEDLVIDLSVRDFAFQRKMAELDTVGIKSPKFKESQVKDLQKRFLKRHNLVSQKDVGRKITEAVSQFRSLTQVAITPQAMAQRKGR